MWGVKIGDNVTVYVVTGQTFFGTVYEITAASLILRRSDDDRVLVLNREHIVATTVQNDHAG